MDKPYIAIAVNEDDETLWDDHFGEAPRYHIYDREGQLIEKRPNPYWTAEHEMHTGPKRIVDILPECGVFIARHMGNGQRKLPQEFGVQPILTQEHEVLTALDQFLDANRS